MALKDSSRTILAARAPQETPLEHQFWRQFGAYSAKQGWQLLIINAQKMPTPPMKGVLSLDLPPDAHFTMAGTMKHLPAEGTELNLPWLTRQDIGLIEGLMVRRNPDQPHTGMMTTSLIRLAHFADATVRTLRPAVVLTWNESFPISNLFRRAGLYYGSHTVLLERSPFDSIWVEEKGLFAESQIWQYSRERWSNGPIELRERGEAICNRLASNPNTAFRATRRTEWSANHELRRPVFFLPVDGVAGTYWGQDNHPQGKIDYPLFDDPHQAIDELARLVHDLGGSLVVKSHPACRQITADKMPIAVDVVPGDVGLSQVIESADAVIVFNTKVAFSAMAMNKPTVTLAPNPVAASGATYRCTERNSLPDVLKEALSKSDLEERLSLFRSFCGFLASEVFYGATSHDALHARGPADLVDDLVAKAGPVVPHSRTRTCTILTNIAMLATGDGRASYQDPAEEDDTKTLPGWSMVRGRLASVAPPGWTKEPSTPDRRPLYLKELSWRPMRYLSEQLPSLVMVGRFARWSLGVLKGTFFGIGGIALLVVAGFFVAGALVAEPLRWYLIGIAGALLLLCGGVLALSYARSLLNRSFAEQRKQIAANGKAMAYMRKEVASINKGMVDLNKGISTIKDDVLIIGYDVLKEQGKLADRVPELETRAGKDTGEEQPTHETGQ